MSWLFSIVATMEHQPLSDLRTILTGPRNNAVHVVTTRPQDKESTEPKMVRVVEVVDLDSHQ